MVNKKNYHIFVIFILLFSITIVLVGCNEDASKPNEVEYFEEEIETENFVMTLEGPKQVEAEKKFNVTGTLEYKGEEQIELFHGEPIIKIWLKNDSEERIYSLYGVPENYGYEDRGYITTIEPGDKMSVKNTSDVDERKTESRRKIDSPGTYYLDAQTTILKNESADEEEFFKGKNYERFLEEDMTDRVKEIEKSKIAIEEPIKITAY